MSATFFSPAMPFAMRPDDVNRPARYHRGHLDTDWQKDLILPFQLNAQYRMPVEITDPFRFQVKSTPLFGHQLQLVDCAGRFVYNFSLSSSAAVAGDVADDGAQFTTYHFALSDWNDLTASIGHQIDEGVYYLVYRINYTGSDLSLFISEPIHIKARHEDTILIEYWHDTYKYGIPFPAIAAKFRKRVYGYVDTYVPKTISTVYQDQNSDTQTLDYAPYRTWRLFVGHTTRRQSGGIADWELDKLNRILGCDHVIIDGKAFAASTANPSWNIQTGTSTPLKVADVEIQEAVDSEDFTTSTTPLFLFATGTYPYAIGHIRIGGFLVSGARRVANSTDEGSAITIWNAVLLSQELAGTIVKVGSAVYYNNGPGERYTTADVVKLTQKFSFLHTPSGVNNLTMTLGNATGVISWGDGTAEEAIVTTSTAFNHSYGGAGFYTVEIYGALGSFVMNEANTSTLTGPMPANLTLLSLQLMTFTSNAFDFSVVSNCAATLSTLLVANCSLTAINSMPSYQFPRLSNVQFAQNSLTQAQMNLCIDNVKNNAYANSVNNGLLNVAAQVPPVTLTAPGASAKTALQAIGWSVFN